MEAKRIAMMAATGSAAFMVGFAAVGLVAMAAETLTQISKDTARFEPVAAPMKVEEPIANTEGLAPNAEVVDEWPTEPEYYEIPDGTYYADDSRHPRQFRDLESFTFEMYDYQKQLEDGTYGVPIPPRGSITVGKTTYKFTRISVGKDMISFQTEERSGVSYRFTGKLNNFDLLRLNRHL